MFDVSDGNIFEKLRGGPNIISRWRFRFAAENWSYAEKQKNIR